MGFLRRKSSSSRSTSSSSRGKSKGRKKSKSLPARIRPERSVDHDDCDDDGGRRASCSCAVSLAVGIFSSSGVSSLTASGSRGRSISSSSEYYYSDGEGGGRGRDDDVRDDRSALPSIEEAPLAPMPSRVFIRTADLPHMKDAVTRSRHSSFSELGDDELVEHVHRPSSNPPLPSITHDPKEGWVALDDGNEGRAPLAEAAAAALVRTALDACMDRGMWTANGPTAKLLKSGNWDDTIFAPADEGRGGPVPVPHARGSKGEADVLVWSGTWSHEYYGHDLPAIRCEAIVNMSPRDLADLLVDSGRAREYNKMSVGRDDIMVLHEDDGTVTKVCVARTRPPMLGKTLVLKNLLHMERLPGGGGGGGEGAAGYVIVSRAIAHADDEEADEDPKAIRSEMLMGLNVIRSVEGDPDRCVLINLNHLRSPMIPMMFAKKLGLGAAVNFINDIRALC